MRLRFMSVLVLVSVVPLLAVSARADILGAAATYAVLATTQVTNPPTNLADTVITGNMGDTSCTGFVLGTGCSLGFGTVSGTVNSGNAPWVTALAASNIAYTALANTPSTNNFTGSCLGSGVGCINNLAPGVYTSTLSSTLLNGALTLAGGSNSDPLWIFEMAAGFTTASNSSVLVTGTGSASSGVYFEVGSQATLGDNTQFQGNILAGTAVVFDPGAQITCGRAFTDTAAGTAVTFAGNNPATPSGIPNLVSNTCAESTSGYNGGATITLPNGGGTGVGAGDTGGNGGDTGGNGGGAGGNGGGAGGNGGGPSPVPEPGTWALLASGLLATVLLTCGKLRVSSLSC